MPGWLLLRSVRAQNFAGISLLLFIVRLPGSTGRPVDQAAPDRVVGWLVADVPKCI
ncbi:hypothetical protein [Pedobacter sp. MR22-3]|uniref:hypothetical protein n=1 Tax=Pedobacter sp. MR22-3 TaxID=2994552 RepID=UPI00224566D3|nr:hypothetical protein [Pedobacter sp. MR22-3]MCX2585229.1 hypothetical protein [Pedobacter sp. MR22-3]